VKRDVQSDPRYGGGEVEKALLKRRNAPVTDRGAITGGGGCGLGHSKGVRVILF